MKKTGLYDPSVLYNTMTVKIWPDVSIVPVIVSNIF